ncbi:MAG: hypothetical protein OM95_06815 [Bdellovibrio sp. ArHS]|uniref:hypothetical protein n=1 Tax=Bdellovibrio sp. ArHS TaxID=1569284 RepID=UPI000583EAF4|nr:hypothetical protein [Bdellovibrio sp. ArHS]KHD88825.1 MAG: hypothetical protein OM95_06815 [Bdellovibrio sp. ArHS]
MKKKYNLAVKTGEYQKDGQTKGRYQNVGAVMESEKGQFILLDKTFNPAGIQDGKNSVLIHMFEEKKEQNSDSFNDDVIPF